MLELHNNGKNKVPTISNSNYINNFVLVRFSYNSYMFTLQNKRNKTMFKFNCVVKSLILKTNRPPTKKTRIYHKKISCVKTSYFIIKLVDGKKMYTNF